MEEISLQLCEAGRRAYSHGLVAGTEGNLSVLLDEQRVLCTPTMMCKGMLTPADLCVLDRQGRLLAGTRRPSSEMAMHLSIYDADPEIRAVVHAHPPYATSFALLGQAVPTSFLPESVVFFGEIPLAPYATTGTAAMGDVLRPLVRGHCVALLQNHGAVAWARGLESAYCCMESLEAVCKTLHLARQMGRPAPIAEHDLEALRKLRRKFLAAQGEQPP